MKIEKAKNISKMIYIDVILRTSGYGMFIGIFLAIFVIGVQLNIVNAIAGFLVLVLMQGLAQHSLDTIMDKAPVEHSAFRKFAIKAFSTEGLRRIYLTATVISTVVVIVGVFIIKHYLIIPVFLLGAYCIYQYAKTNIEWYPSLAFAMCAVGGYLTQVDLRYTLDYQQFLLYNMPICSAFFLLYGLYKIGQVLYRQDDYQREMTTDYQITYHRANLRWIHHQTQLPIMALIASIAGYIKDQPLYSEIALVLVLIYLTIWIAGRHKTCNNVFCKYNPARRFRNKDHGLHHYSAKARRYRDKLREEGKWPKGQQE